MDVQKLGAFIQNRRKDLGMTQGELGAKLNVTDKAISRWERGVGFPDVKLLEPLADALQISIQELIQCEKTKEETLQVTDEQTEPSLETGKGFRLGKYRRPLAALCCLGYVMTYALASNQQLVEQLVWLSPLNRLFFLASVAAFLFASYKEANYA